MPAGSLFKDTDATFPETYVPSQPSIARIRRRVTMRLLLLLLALSLSSSHALQPLQVTRTTRSASSSTCLQSSVISSLDEADFDFDEGAGGVRLAKESAILIEGVVNLKKRVPAYMTKLRRYKNVQATIDMSSVLATGQGEEVYVDPGTSTSKSVVYAPLAAVEQLLGAKPASSSDEVMLNFLGGPDLQTREVLLAAQAYCEETNTKRATFYSLSHASFSLGSATVTLTSGGDPVFVQGNDAWTVRNEDRLDADEDEEADDDEAGEE